MSIKSVQKKSFGISFAKIKSTKEGTFLALILVFFLLTLLIRVIQFVKHPVGTEKARAQLINALYVRVSKANLEVGDTFSINVDLSHLPNTPYNGNLEYMLQVCDENGLNCQVNGGVWLDEFGIPITVVDGTAAIDVAGSVYSSGTYAYRVKPIPNTQNLDWSNLFSFNVSTLVNLKDTSQYFLMPTSQSTFLGINRSATASANFRTDIGFEPAAPVCSEPNGQIIYFMKGRPEGYPNPKTPWFDIRNPDGYSYNNSKMSIVHWQEKVGWHDEYITSWGSQNYEANFGSPFVKNQQFQNLVDQVRLGSNQPIYPPGLLLPKYVGISWGVNNALSSKTFRDSTTSFCSIPLNEEPDSLWSTSSDIAFLDPWGEVMRIKVFDGENNFLLDDAKFGLREDWYFAKDVGLVRIDVNYFCPSSWGSFPNCLPCNQNTDCTVNEFMKAPNISLTSTTGPTPTPPPTLFVDVTADPDTGVAPLSVDMTVNITGTDPGPYIFRFDCDGDYDWEQQVSNPSKNYTLENACIYNNPGTYIALVQVDGFSVISYDTILIQVFPQPTDTPVPTFTPAPTDTPPPPTCNKQGDANGDCKVDGIDYAIWFLNFGKFVTGGPSEGDFDTSGRVDGIDYAIWFINFGT